MCTLTLAVPRPTTILFTLLHSQLVGFCFFVHGTKKTKTKASQKRVLIALAESSKLISGGGDTKSTKDLILIHSKFGKSIHTLIPFAENMMKSHREGREESWSLMFWIKGAYKWVTNMPSLTSETAWAESGYTITCWSCILLIWQRPWWIAYNSAKRISTRPK